MAGIINHRKAGLAALAIAVVLLQSVVSLGQVVLGAGADASPLVIEQLPLLAEDGEFGRALALLRGHPQAQAQDGRITSLISDLEQYQQHVVQHTESRTEAYDVAFQEMINHVEAEEIDDALIKALDAHNLAVDPDAMLQNPQVQALIAQTEELASQAQEAGDWLEALNLYRALDLLVENTPEYRQRVHETSRHMRVLRLYAPEEIYRLYAARAQRLGKDAPSKLHVGDETWRDRLEGVEPPMLQQTLAQAARRHVDNMSYRGLVEGAFDAITILAYSKGLAGTFGGFEDVEAVQRFRQGLADLRQELDQHKRSVNFLDATGMVDRIIELNNQTIELPEDVVVHELTEGMTSKLDDFTAVIWPHEIEHFSRNTQGKFYGVGIQISIRDGRLIVVSPLEDTPAQQAGILAGDIIVTVDERDTSTWTLDQAVRQITGPKGTQVVLGIERVGETEPLEFELTRAEIIIESIRGWQRKETGGWDYVIDRDHGIGYVRLSQFIPHSATDLDKAMNDIERTTELKALILDLRFNPGGLLSSAVEVADRFLESGTIVSTVGRNGRRTSRFRARSDHTHPSIPVVVLINEGSASASEIVAGALQDYQRAVIIGTRSFGKGSVQDLFPLQGGKAYLKLTTQYYKLPRGRIIHRKPGAMHWGIEPDLEVRVTAQQVADAIEFRQAVDVLRGPEDRHPKKDMMDAQEAEDLKDIHQEIEAAPTADQILERAMDPQLEAALLVLKTRLLAQDMALAQNN